jgi:hypothetical protein
MDDMDIVEFNQNRGRISLGPNAAQLYEYLGESDDEDRPWPVYYGSLTGVGVLGLVASQIGAAAVGLTPTVVATVVLVGLVGVSAAQTLDRRDED